jgi:hypothetical protein
VSSPARGLPSPVEGLVPSEASGDT